jgi:ABC-type molybdate transport system substrate-binding protein
MRRLAIPLVGLVTLASPAITADALSLFAAGSLKAALTDVARSYEQAYGTPVETDFAASGLLRERNEGGERPDVFASANMAHPQALLEKGMGGPVALFARNRLCALAQADLDVETANVLDVMLRDDVKLGTSTPKADPSGEYAWELFEKADALRPGSFAALDAKALKLTGGPDSAKAPEGRNTYGWVMEEGNADLFLTYCTNAKLAASEVAGLEIVQLPEELTVGADYGLIVLNAESPDGWRLAMFILGPAGQAVLGDYGFAVGGTPAGG